MSNVTFFSGLQTISKFRGLIMYFSLTSFLCSTGPVCSNAVYCDCQNQEIGRPILFEGLIMYFKPHICAV
jgi:hypothetical protein